MSSKHLAKIETMANQVRDIQANNQFACHIEGTDSVVPVDSTTAKSSSFGRYRKSFYKYFQKNLTLTSSMSSRVSLSRQSVKYYQQKTAAYKFLQKPNGPFGRAYHLIVSMLILICLVLTVLCSFKEITVILNEVLYGFDVLIFTILVIEFSVRLWSSECICHYRGCRGKLRFFSSPFRIFDIIVIFTSLLIIILSYSNNYLWPSFQWIRFFQTFKMFRLEHSFRPWLVMSSVIWSQREHLYITTYTSILALFLTSFLVYFVEKDVNPQFDNLGQSLWWAVVTLCTIGYGDIYPVTAWGKVLSSFCAIIGVSLFALPAGILGTGLALKVQENQRIKQIGKRKVPAVQFIQSVWRFHFFSRNPTKAYAMLNQKKTSEGLKASPKRVFKKLTNNEINCFYFVLKTQYFVCRQHFTQTLKPYDVKDVMDQYSTGQLEMLIRVKHIYQKVSNIDATAHSVLKAQVETKNLFNYRLVKLEEFMEVTENKLDQLIKLQLNNKDLYESILAAFEPLNQNGKGEENDV